MDPYDLRVHQITFREEEIQDDNLDAFSNVIHYDSALIDSNTGKKPNTQQVSNSSQFAWSSTHSRLPGSQEHFLPTPFLQRPKCQPAYIATRDSDLVTLATITTTTAVKSSFECKINRLIKDIYSEVEIPFTPLREAKTIPDWILLDSEKKDHSYGNQKFVAQPSRVKVTHVYNQTVWSEVPSTPAQVTQFLTNPDSRLTPQTVVTDCDIRTLLQISANTTAARNQWSGRQTSAITRMAQNNLGSPSVSSTEPFESVAEALHLQQSVIGNRSIAPAPPEVVAQIIAEAERKIKEGQTPTPESAVSAHATHWPLPGTQPTQPTTAGSHGQIPTVKPAQLTTASLPPAPRLPDTAVTRELIRLHTQDITRSSERSSWFGSSHKPPDQERAAVMHAASTNTVVKQGSISSQALPQPFNQSNTGITAGSLSQANSEIDDSQSIASSCSELEALNENATENFLRSLPPVKAVKLSDIMPAPDPRPDISYSPPVKETSFRPVIPNVDSLLENGSKAASTFQSFVTDSGVFSPDSDRVVSPQSITHLKTNIVIPKPGPLFHSSPKVTVSKSLENMMKTSFLSSHQGDSSGNTYEHLDEVKREKAKLEGQLEMLSIEAQATLQERAELQAQVASLKLKLMSQKANKNDAEKDMLKADFASLKQLRISLESSLSDLQRQLEEKSEEGRNLQEELNQSQDVCDRLNLKMKEIRDDVKTKEVTIQALKNKVAELYVEVQASMQTKMEADNEARSAKSDLLALQRTKDWYQQQLEIATKARSELQKELTVLQAQAASQSSIIERLKNENAKLRQQFSEIQNKALREKELLAKHLEAIESDMMDREAAFQEIQRERSFLEDTFNTKIQSSEDERNRISMLMQMTTDLENQLDKAHSDLKKKQNQIVQLENENIELMKKLSLSQEAVIEKDCAVEDLKQNMIDLENRLKAFQNSIVNKDSEILKLKEEKAMAEIALKSALQEKNSVDKVLDALKGDMGKVEKSFKLMRQELNTKSTEMYQIQSKSMSAEEKIESLSKELENEKRSYEVAKLEFENKSHQINELQGQKIKLESEVLVLREKLSSMEVSHETAMSEKQFLDTELSATREKLDEAKEKLKEKVEVESKQKSSVDDIEHQEIKEECEQLKARVVQIQKDSKKDLMKQKAKSAKLNQDLKAVKDELMERQKAFDENIEILSQKLRELAGEKEKLETELSMVHRKYELSMLEQKDQIGTELQSLANELQQVRLEKQSLETQYMELQHARDLDLQQYQQQLSVLEGEMHQMQEALAERTVTMETNQELMLELEKEKGRLAGLMQSNGTLKHHVSQLEEALAGRESLLVDSQTKLQQVVREKEQESHDSIKRVQGLEEGLQKEKDGHRETRKQIGLKITENKKLRRQNDNLKQDQEQLKQELETRTQELNKLQAELETSRQSLLGLQSEMTVVEGENKALQRELERVQQQLTDNIAREPVLQEQMKSLEWQLQLKGSELEAAHQQLEVVEERQQAEIHTINLVVQERGREVDALKVEVGALKQDKHNQQAKISELRSALKSSIQYHKMVQKMAKFHTTTGSGDADSMELPPLPFDLDTMDRLLQDTTVRALESKPLDNLQNCLLNLRSEISGLQAQMDINTTTVESSTNTWSTLEQQVEELRHVVQTISSTTMSSSTTNSLAAAAVDLADRSSQIMDI